MGAQENLKVSHVILVSEFALGSPFLACQTTLSWATPLPEDREHSR